MRKVWSENKLFLIPYIFVLLMCGIVLYTWSKSDIHLFINRLHCSSADIFFKYITHLGDGFAIVVVSLILLFVKLRYALITAISGTVSGLFITQTLKHTVFSSVPRPRAYFEGIYDLHFVDGVKVYTMNSFPSGHSTTAFALFFSLSCLVKKPLLKITFFILACFAAYSRMYLSQHFLQDVVAGSIIGTITAFVTVFVINTEK